MAKSLQEQLLELGVAAKKPTRQAEPSKRRAKKGTKPPKPGLKSAARPAANGREEELALVRAYALRERAERQEAEQARARKQQEERRRRALNQAIRKIVQEHRLNRDDAEVARNFLFRGRIRKVNVTPEQLVVLNAGEIGVVYLAGSYHLLPAAAVAEVRALSAEHVPDLRGSEPDEDEFPVPDDLIW